MSLSGPDVHSNYYAATRTELRAFLPDRYSRVLEIGCGRGGFRSNLADASEVWGVEPVSAAAEFARHRLDYVLTGTYQEVHSQLPDTKFDLVVCNDVIEHMADDVAFLNSIRKKISSGGYIMGSIPNMRNLPELEALLFGKQWEYRDDGVLDRTHLRFYTIKSFPKLLKSCGFEVIKLSGINRKMRPSSLLWRPFMWTPWLRDTRWQQFAFLAKLTPRDA